MKTDIKGLFNLKHFFKVVKSTNSSVTYNLKKPSQILIRNIHLNWMQYIYSKTNKEMPIYLKRNQSTTSIFGCIEQNLLDYDELTTFEHNFSENNAINKTELQLELIVPQQDAMQFFIKWQRYRKYWWSTISTTPSLFTVNDIKYEEKSANVDIIAQLQSGEQQVENVTIKFDDNDKTSRLVCRMSLKNALIILLLDALNNNSKEEYLRLHRKIAPYKISFGLHWKESNEMDALKELATLLYHKLESNKISTWLPEFTLPYESQIKENLHLGVTYTAILSEDTLKNGIFKLMNSSTMLGEQVHVADFHNYAALLFEK